MQRACWQDTDVYLLSIVVRQVSHGTWPGEGRVKLSCWLVQECFWFFPPSPVSTRYLACQHTLSWPWVTKLVHWRGPEVTPIVSGLFLGLHNTTSCPSKFLNSILQLWVWRAMVCLQQSHSICGLWTVEQKCRTASFQARSPSKDLCLCHMT